MPRTHAEIMAAARAHRGEEAPRRWGPQNVGRNLAALGQMLTGGGGGRGGSGGTSERLGDRIPEAPDYATTETGIEGPYGETTVAGTGAGVPRAEEARAREQYAAEREDERTATEFAEGVERDVADIEGRADVLGTRVEEDRREFQREMGRARDEIDRIPREVTNEFDRLRGEYGEAADASFDRIDSQRGEALTNAEQGRSAAMQAAVQGIQGNVNTQVAQIMANPDLTQSQKQSMVAQTRLAGASSIAPAIGQTVLAFNQLSGDIATKFGAITGQIESNILAGVSHLAGLSGQAFAEAQVAVGQMTTQLLEIDAGASASFSSSQNQLLATRTHATMTGNEILLQTLPEMSTPYLDLTGAAVAAYTVSSDIVKSDFAMRLQEYATKLQVIALREMQGNPLTNIIEGFFGGLASGGLPGAVLSGGAAAIESLDPNKEWI